ncbi:protein S100-A1-like [Cheilinus undulatus]|uniref:protein S100-A1-like n=1 Tax=Cheilinus undulatus TaxID=241271 RepID=UPI001BD5F282|nr:protein S100-A1-like [Cheilinus undulatus]
MDSPPQMSALDGAVCLMVMTFQKHLKEGDSLTKCQAKQLIMEEMPGLIQALECQGGFEANFNKLDLNDDGKISFSEFAMMVGGMACACNKELTRMNQQQQL